MFSQIFVEASAEKYRTYARERGVTGAGSMYGTLDVARHTCAILGRMLGHTEAIRHLEEMEYPPLLSNGEEDYAHSMLVFSVSLGNWVFSARQALKASKVQRIKIWNLDCAGNQRPTGMADCVFAPLFRGSVVIASVPSHATTRLRPPQPPGQAGRSDRTATGDETPEPSWHPPNRIAHLSENTLFEGAQTSKMLPHELPKE